MSIKPTNLKIKSQSPPQRCEVCHKADCFEPSTGACSRCGVLVRWQADTATKNIAVPIGIAIERYDNALNLVQGWYNRKTVKFLIPFTVFWNLVVAVFWIVIPVHVVNSFINDGDFTQLTGLFFLIPHSAVGLSFAYYLLATYKNQTTISVTNKTLSIKHAPMPWFGNQDISTSSLIQLYVKQVEGWSVNDQVTYLYELRAKLKNDKDVKLIGGLISEEVGHFLEQQIENYLGIVDEPIQGEVPK
ncbi:MAG: hypothetical protein WAQ98_13105 [Blastocatellia bacterium]